MAERIFVMDEDGNLESMDETPFAEEDILQELIAVYPELLAGEQMRPDNPRRFILITREKGIADKPDAGNRWSVDHLLIDQDAVPTLVETKRSSSSEIRRQIVGQMLDYAAHATGTWSVDEIRETFETSADDPDRALAELLQSDGEPDTETFWQDVETNLAAKRLRLLFVADGIPDELARVVEFLNEQMPRIEVLAVEIKQFKGESRQTLVPSVIGRLAAKPASRGGRSPRVQQSKEEFLDRFDDVSAREAAARLIGVAESTHRTSYGGTRRTSITVNCPLWRNRVTVAWLAPPGDPDDHSGNSNHFVFGRFQDYANFPAELQNRLMEWSALFENDGYEEINAWNANHPPSGAYAIPYADAVENIDTLVERLQGVVNDLANLRDS